ncbi:hypothetical protein [Streptomyces akebiae]|uniref:Uncharacterized protein n=1 Tax=Streptomyces akebiae TaxID=2865673 RepID=A0ABX8XX45_9ACTN|nr:hypothetical protein [Streptomyces akebiae]QYX80390.1 hypothetical protein K1J60_31195 [Streptomyces akebiae]
MDAYEELLSLARNTASILVEKGIRPRPYTADDGTTVEGWRVEQLPGHERSEYRGSDNWEEFRSANELILATDGRFFTYTEIWNSHSVLSGSPVDEHTRELRHQSSAHLVSLGPGKPFAAASTMLERLPWTAVSYAPPQIRPVSPAPPAPRRGTVPPPVRPPARSGDLVGAVLGFGGGFLLGCAVGCVSALVLGVALSLGGLDGDTVGVTTFSAAMFCVATGTAIGTVQGWRKET